MSEELLDWLDSVSGTGWWWYVKRLSGNDTLLNGSHQAGPYIPRDVVHHLFPSLTESNTLNPRRSFQVVIDSHHQESNATAIWYNNRLVASGTQNECRITGWGGRSSPILDPDSTGAVCIFAFYKPTELADCEICRVWLCVSPEEEDRVEGWIGRAIDPRQSIFWSPEGGPEPFGTPATQSRLSPRCWLSPEELPSGWLSRFPAAIEVVKKAIELSPGGRGISVDERLLVRRECELNLFLSIEQAYVLPRIREGFVSIDSFIEFANSVANRRKSRAGRSLELHAREIFFEEDVPHSHGEVSEGNKRPDFLFPSAAAYRDTRYPASKLRMLGVKTTCKDRWRQILNEANRIEKKHLLTLQEGVSLNQFEEMSQAGVILVVPSKLHKIYHEAIRPHILSLEEFIRDTLAATSS